MRRAPLPTHGHEHCATLRTMSTSDSTTPAHQAPPPATDERAPDPADPLDLDQAAAYAGRAPATLRRVVRQGKLPRRYRSGLYGPELIFARADIDAWLADQARAVEAMPAASASRSDEDATATNDAPSDSTAVQSGDAMGTAARLYALVALAYAQRLHDAEERLAAVEEQARAASDGWQLQAGALAGVRARLADLEERQQQAQQEPRNTQERRGAGPDRRSPDAVWIAEERRRADRRAQQDRERFEETVMGQYVSPDPVAVPRADEFAPPPAAVNARPADQAAHEHPVEAGNRHQPPLLARILAHFR